MSILAEIKLTSTADFHPILRGRSAGKGSRGVVASDPFSCSLCHAGCELIKDPQARQICHIGCNVTVCP